MRSMRLFLGLIPAIALAGCSHKHASSSAASSSDEGPGNPAVMAAARRKAPVLDRALTANDLNSLKQFMDIHRSGAGKYPANMTELKQVFGNDGQKLYQLIEDGTLVMTWKSGDNAVLAYDKRTKDSDGMVLTTSGVQRMTADELKQALR